MKFYVSSFATYKKSHLLTSLFFQFPHTYIMPENLKRKNRKSNSLLYDRQQKYRDNRLSSEINV